MPNKKKLIVIVGPTAIGKTKLAIDIATHFNTEILSADSRQFFKEMKIGTAAPTADELTKVKHHFVGHLSIHDNYDAGKFEADAIQTLDHLFKHNNYAVLVGGSGLYINAVCNGFDSMPEVKPEIRNELNLLFKEKGIKALQQLLEEKDSEYYKTVDKNNPQRLIRALEICISSGMPYSTFRKKEKKERGFECIKIGLNTNREHLYAKINMRVDKMLEEGLEKEVESLMPYQNLNALQTVGYRELFDYKNGKITFDKAIELIKQNTRNFAKRQLTWFKKDDEIKWFEPDELEKVKMSILH